MFTLDARVDGFKFAFPKTFIVEELQEKYAELLNEQNSFIHDPVQFLNETIKSISVLGFNDASLQQTQHMHGKYNATEKRLNTYSASDYTYRAQTNPVQLIDKTFVVTFRHTLGYINYFMLFENFFWLYDRQLKSQDTELKFNIDLLDVNGVVRSRIVMENPIIDGIEALNFDMTQPTSVASQFTMTFKYSNIDYQFIKFND